ncbi:hypothetical protein BGZ80_003886 [Entomortierella chlamydospora]|uniref:Uncharacterized protein n=1 Tax=Entomortierella chlamydospora TaxID=101097 RepID=A0A9P6SWD1_9FUNG|nr:hypothetical protein BGZ80_003886 [Entomortierella chlamydospora]
MAAYNNRKLRPARNFSLSVGHQIFGFGTVTVTDSSQTDGAPANPAAEPQPDLPTNYESDQAYSDNQADSTYTQDDSTNDEPS